MESRAGVRDPRRGWQAYFLAVLAGVVLMELLIVQPFRVFGLDFAADGQRFARLVDLLRAAVWTATPVVVGLGFLGGLGGGEDPVTKENPERWLWTMLDTFTEGMVGFDHQGRVAFANQSALRMLGRSALPDGTPMAAFADIPRLRTTVARALLEGTMETVEVQVQPGRRILLARAAPCDEGALLLMVDVTSERAVIETREAFLSDAAHELRTPVAGIQLGVEALELGGMRDEARGPRLLAGVGRHAERMRLLLDDLLSLARIGSSELREIEDVALADVFDGVLDELPTTAGLVLECSELAYVRTDGLALHRVVVNLIRNGLWYGQNVYGSVGFLGDRLRITIDDDGPGIPEAIRERVFERFFRADDGRTRERGGTGLGLAIVKELVERDDGCVWVEASPMGGARFVVELRRAITAPLGPGGERD